MSLKSIYYVLIMDEVTFYGKDNWVDRKPVDKETIISADTPFICKNNGAQNVDTYNARKFQDMSIMSAEIVIAEILPSARDRLYNGEDGLFFAGLENNLVSLGYKKLNKEQIKQLRTWFDVLKLKELETS